MVQRRLREEKRSEPRLVGWRDSDDYDEDYDEAPPRYRRRGRSGGIIRGLALVAVGGALAFVAFLYLQGGTDALTRMLPAPQQPGAAPAAAAADATAANVVVPDNNYIARQAQIWGIQQCLSGIIDTSGFLTRNNEAFWQMTRGPVDANRELFTATLVTRDRNSGVTGVSGMFAAPAGTGACNTAYLSTLYFPEACARTRELSFAVFNQRLNLGPFVEAYATADGRASIYLLPAGENGCVAVKSELFY